MIEQSEPAEQPEAFTEKSAREGIRLDLAGSCFCVQTALPTVVAHLQRFYPGYVPDRDHDFTDYYVAVRKPGTLRNWLRPQVVFELDGFLPFKPLPLEQAPAHFEWGLNWCIASQSHQYLVVHAAVVEKDSCGLLLPGRPGSGKSTLCAGLIANGWRLLSDEMALIRLERLDVQPAPRPISLKNRSIGVIKSCFTEQDFGPVIGNTVKGDLTHLRPPVDAIRRRSETVEIAHIVFPSYVEHASTRLAQKPKAHACMALIENSFNFNILGAAGFETCRDLVDRADCNDLEYSDLESAIEEIGRLTGIR